jgi:hypothetical protein
MLCYARPRALISNTLNPRRPTRLHASASVSLVQLCAWEVHYSHCSKLGQNMLTNASLSYSVLVNANGSGNLFRLVTTYSFQRAYSIQIANDILADVSNFALVVLFY